MKVILFSAEAEVSTTESNTITLEILNDHYFFDIIKELKFSVDNNSIKELFIELEGKPINNKKDIFLVIDPFNIDINSKPFISELYKRVGELYLADAKVNAVIHPIYNQLVSYLENLISELDIDYSLKTEFEIKDLLKMLALEFKEAPDDPFSTLSNLIDLVSELKLFKVIVIINPRNFLPENSLSELLKRSSYKHLQILIIQNKHYEKNSYEAKISVDEDLYSR